MAALGCDAKRFIVPEIRQLPTSVINKIAAGEVIERPASVVKELLENAVDAGSTRVDVSIENGGNDLIRLSDNGCGIAREQLALAVASHATSKIVDADDLFRVSTLGFRGEALASIAEVSRLTLRSRPHDADAGYELVVNGGEHRPIAPCGCSPGTTLEVRHLFFNTPVRRKYLKTPQTEMGHIAEAFTRIALAHPQVHFTLSHNGRVVHDLTPTESWADRIGHFFGPEIRQALIPIHAEDDEQNIAIHGFVAEPSQNRSHNRMQYLFLNGRHIRDKALQHALGEAYRGLLMVGRFPIAFLRLEMSAEAVDVNVHPAKLEVRFQDGGRIYSQLLAAIRNRFLATDLTAKAQLTRPSDRFQKPTDSREPRSGLAAGNDLAARPEASSSFELAPHREVERATPLPFSDVFPRRPLPPWPPTREATPGASPDVSEAGSEASVPSPAVIPPSELTTNPHRTPLSPFDQLPDFGPTESVSVSRGGTIPTAVQPPESQPSPSRRWDTPTTSVAGHHLPKSNAVQIHHRYIVSECDEGMIVIDQHALHERVLYEQIRAKVLGGSLETQALLVPLPVTLSPAEAALALDQQETLAAVGLQVEPFGGNAIVLRSYPAMLRSLAPEEVLRQALDLLQTEGKVVDRRDVLDELLHMMSCKAAVKAGDPLSEEEIQALIEYRDLCQDAHHCPHGRPTALVFSREELDRRFKRI
ncbi:MAG: DNA mismatch repair endonuclease MutL [Pirellulaceae bacterium]